jgi:hypothetical protein
VSESCSTGIASIDADGSANCVSSFPAPFAISEYQHQGPSGAPLNLGAHRLCVYAGMEDYVDHGGAHWMHCRVQYNPTSLTWELEAHLANQAGRCRAMCLD